MRFAPLSSITILDNRQRREFNPQALMELTESIRKNGLMHPIVVRTVPVARFQPRQFVLVAGERRMRAIADLWALGETLRFNGKPLEEGQIPFVTLGELSPIEAEEAELDENLRRKDLTWQEHAAALQRLHSLRQKQAEERGEVQSIAATAEEVHGRSDGSYHNNVRKELVVAKHLDNAEVAAAKNVDEAFKVLKRNEARDKNLALAAEVGKTFNANLHTLLNVDCLEWLRAHPGGEFDVICTDPPYGMNAHAFGDGAKHLTEVSHHYDDSPEAWRKLMSEWCGLAYRVCKPQAHAYVFCDIDMWAELKALMRAAGWYVFRTPLINTKQALGRVPLPDKGPRRQYEIILYAIKGDKTTTHIYPDVISTSNDEHFTHGAQKPVALFTNLLQRSVCPGDKVLDTFAGTGPIFPAAHLFKCIATGLESNPEYYGVALGRLRGLDAEPELPL